MDADGDTDMVLRNVPSNAWKIFNAVAGDLTSNTDLALDSTAVWQFKGVGDMDGDGDSDVILRDSGTGAWKISTIEGGAVTGNTGLGLYSNTDWSLFQ